MQPHERLFNSLGTKSSSMALVSDLQGGASFASFSSPRSSSLRCCACGLSAPARQHDVLHLAIMTNRQAAGFPSALAPVVMVLIRLGNTF